MSPNLALGRFIRAPLPDTLHKEIKPNISVFGSIKKFNGEIELMELLAFDIIMWNYKIFNI
jgi:hypothetical protein